MNMVKKILSAFFVLAAIIISASVSKAADVVNSVYPHWQKSPISVYIENGQKSGSMRNAFNRWQSASYGKLKFTYVNDKDNADIKVKFSEVSSNYNGAVGSSSVQKSGNEIISADINISVGSKKYSNNYVYTVMLQEVGHVLGLSDNPRKTSSIMHTPVNENQDILKLDVRELFRVNGWSYAHKNMLE